MKHKTDIKVLTLFALTLVMVMLMAAGTTAFADNTSYADALPAPAGETEVLESSDLAAFNSSTVIGSNGNLTITWDEDDPFVAPGHSYRIGDITLSSVNTYWGGSFLSGERYDSGSLSFTYEGEGVIMLIRMECYFNELPRLSEHWFSVEIGKTYYAGRYRDLYYAGSNSKTVTMNWNGRLDIPNISKVEIVVKPFLRMTYDLNGGTGTAPTDTRVYEPRDWVGVQKNTATRAGYLFKGWNTKPDGSGTAYRPGDGFRIRENTTLYAQWERITVAYMDWDGTKLVEKAGDDGCADAETVSSSTTAFADGKWYVVTGNTTVNERITVNGTAHLILRDGTKLTAAQGICVNEGSHLILHGQSGGTGRLTAGGSAGQHAAGIGGGERSAGGTVVINGCNVTATGGAYGAGIGGGFSGKGGTLTVNGGTVTAIGGTLAAGIGGGQYGAGGTVTINGGTVNATGGYNGAGIGGGMDSEGGTVTVNGGTVTAKGDNYGMGIGGGSDWLGSSVDSGTLILHGGTVTAEGGSYTAAVGGTIKLDAGVTVWAGESENPRTTVSIVNDFAKNHSQRYVYMTNAEPRITGYDLVLDGALKLRFYVQLPAGFQDTGAHMDFTIRGRSCTQNISEAEKIDGKTVFSCPVYSIEMNEPVTAVFRSGSTSTLAWTATVKQYLDMLDANMDKLNLSEGDTAKLTTLIAATRNYGHYMQDYLAGVHHFTVGDGEGSMYHAMPKASDITPLTALPEYKRTWGPNRYDPEVIESMQYFDDFDANTTLNIDLTLKSSPASVTAKVDGKDWTVRNLGGGAYRITIPNIAANNLGKAFHVELTADGKVVYDANLSALSYVSAVLDAQRDQPGEAEALTAFYQYYLAAKAFE